MSYGSKYKGSEVDALLDKVGSGVPLATASANGGVKIGYTASGKNYAVQLDGDGKAYVTVNWTDTNTTYTVATSSADGLMSKSDKSKLDGIAANANNYSLPKATSSALGGLMIGYTTTGKQYAVQLDASGKAYVAVAWENTTYSAATTSANGLMSSSDKSKLDGIAANANNYSLPKATTSALGGVMIGYSASGKNYAVQLDSSGKMYVSVPWTDTNTTYNVATTSANGLMSSSDKSKLDGIAAGANNYSLPQATSSARGGILIGYSTSGKNYAVVLDGSGKAYVNVPWTDTNTTYSVATSSANGLMSSSDKVKVDVLRAYGTTTTVASLDANKEVVFVTLSANASLSASATGASYNGRNITAYVLASGANRVVSIPTSGSYISMCGSSYTIPSGKWAEFNLACVNGIWHIAKMEQE